MPQPLVPYQQPKGPTRWRSEAGMSILAETHHISVGYCIPVDMHHISVGHGIAIPVDMHHTGTSAEAHGSCIRQAHGRWKNDISSLKLLSL